jgi:hypothetical protein
VENKGLSAAVRNDGVKVQKHNQMITRFDFLPDYTVILCDPLDEHHGPVVGYFETNPIEALRGRPTELAAQCAVVLREHGDAQMRGSAQQGPGCRVFRDRE